MLMEKKFRPTELGMLVNEMLEQFFPNILDVDFTAEMEGKLDHGGRG
jgi:DNA topoisomerase I